MRTCRGCSKDDTQVEFKPRANICKGCNAKYMAAYRERNREKIKGQITDWKKNNRERSRAKLRAQYATPEGKAVIQARVAKTPRTWLGHIMSRVKRKCSHPGPHDPKEGPQRDFEVDLDFLLAIYERQDGKCAITNLPMTHRFRDMRSISIDRVDSALGYVPGNVQLVCTAVNRAKNNHAQGDAEAFFREVAEANLVRCSSRVLLTDYPYVLSKGPTGVMLLWLLERLQADDRFSDNCFTCSPARSDGWMLDLHVYIRTSMFNNFLEVGWFELDDDSFYFKFVGGSKIADLTISRFPMDLCDPLSFDHLYEGVTARIMGVTADWVEKNLEYAS